MITKINIFQKVLEATSINQQDYNINDFDNISDDGEGNLIGNCKVCGEKGALISNHTHNKTNEEVEAKNKEERNNLEDMLYVGDFEV